MTEDQPKIVELGAGTDDSTRDVNLDVRGTPGPDFLGQETVDIDGHPMDRPGVQSRIPDDHPDDPRIRRMDTGEELPVLLSSNMDADPVEGMQGSYTVIEEGECPRCGYDRIRSTVNTLAGEAKRTCQACGAVIERREEDGYRMPPTERDRADNERSSAPTIGALGSQDVVDLESGGLGPYISLVAKSSFKRLKKDEVADLYWMLANNGDISPTEEIRDRLDKVDTLKLWLNIMPDNATLSINDDE